MMTYFEVCKYRQWNIIEIKQNAITGFYLLIDYEMFSALDLMVLFLFSDYRQK